MTPETKSETSVEAKAASLDEAKAAAAALLGVGTADIVIEHQEEIAGLFGKKDVRIVASAKPAKKPSARAGAKKAAPEPAPAPVAEEAAPPKPTARKKKGAEPAPAPGQDEDGGEPAPEATPELAQRYVDLLEEILKLADLDANVRVVSLQGRYANLEIDGADASYLVGRKGETLNAVQYLLNVVGVHTFGEGVRVSLEADDYRKRRAEVLEKLARDIAKEVLARGEEAVLDALPAFERRIIHQTLGEIEGVTTYSEGEEPDRRVVIAPAE